MEETLKCKICGVQFTRNGVDEALEVNGLICPHCGCLFTKDDLSPRDWLHKPRDLSKAEPWLELALIASAVALNQPIIGLFVALAILLGALVAYLIRLARMRDEPLSITGPKPHR